MKKFTLSLAVLAALVLLSVDTGVAEARGFRGFGLHLGGRNVHLNIGRSHGYRSYYGGHGVSRHHVLRNTSQVEYHPAEPVLNGDHIDYVPGYYDYHSTGHRNWFSGGHH